MKEVISVIILVYLLLDPISASERCAALYTECSSSKPCETGATCVTLSDSEATRCIPTTLDHVELFGKCAGSDMQMKSCGDGASCVFLNEETSQCLWSSKCSHGECGMSACPQTLVELKQSAYALKVNKHRKNTLEDVPCHTDNGDEETYDGFIGMYHKTLPHDEYGEVDPDAYKIFLKCLHSGDLEICEQIPGSGKLSNPLGGLAFSSKIKDASSFPIPPAPSIASAEMAAMFAELIWMAVLSDIPFTEFGTDPMAAKAAESLAAMEGYKGMGRPMTIDEDGKITIDPATQLFRMDFKDALIGPAISQFLLKPFLFDGIEIEPLTKVGGPGTNYMTDFNEWLNVQNGESKDKGFDPNPSGPVFMRTPRDLGAFAYQDVLFSPFFRAISVAGMVNIPFNSGPYDGLKRSASFTTWGKAQTIRQALEMGCDLGPSWYSKWNVNRYLRPEAFGGLVHLHKTGVKPHYPIHPSLDLSGALEYLFTLNEETNKKRNKLDPSIEPVGTYLLPQAVKEGCLTHPSYPAGHAIVGGAAGTILKAWLAFNNVTESACFPEPVVPLADGSGVESYIPKEGEKCVTVIGEINKLVQNQAQGREMSGFHYRADSWYGILQGEANAIAFLKEQIDLNPECSGEFWFTSFEGREISIKPNPNCRMYHKTKII